MNDTNPFFAPAHIQYPVHYDTLQGQARATSDAGAQMKTQGQQYALPGKASASEIKSENCTENCKAETFSCAADYRDRISVGSLQWGSSTLLRTLTEGSLEVQDLTQALLRSISRQITMYLEIHG